MTNSWLWELANQAQHRIPDPIDYIEMRRKTFGSDMTMSLSRLAHIDEVPSEIYRMRAVRALEDAAQDYACFTNDLFSYQKEVEFEGELHNLVLVVEHFLNTDRWMARDIVADLMAARMRQFEHAVTDELPALFDELDLDETARAALTRHADGLKDWMAGILEWHRRCARYTEDELRRVHRAGIVPAGPDGLPAVRRRLAGPTGLGTSAARLPNGRPTGAPAADPDTAPGHRIPASATRDW
jgi:germacradienol/geosmin synthase